MVQIQNGGQPQQIQAQPQELSTEEESKSAIIDPGLDEEAGGHGVDKQPQSFACEPGEFSFSQDRDTSRERAQREIRHLRGENDDMRRERDDLRRRLGQMELALAALRREQEDIRVPVAELRWLLYFRAPTARQQVMAVVSAGLAALFARDPSFRGRQCATSYARQDGSAWEAFRVDFVGARLPVLRKAMKAALADAHLPPAEISTQQPPRVTLYRQLPELPPMFEGTLAELERALRDAVVE